MRGETFLHASPANLRSYGKRENKMSRRVHTSRLEVTPLLSGDVWRLLRQLTYKRFKKGSGATVTVPAGFITDLASVPTQIVLFLSLVSIIVGHLVPISWLFWVGITALVLAILIPKLGRFNVAAVVHDYLYQYHGYNEYEGRAVIQFHPVTRETADRIFYDIMAAFGVVKWRRTIMYWGVRTTGALAWRGGPKRLIKTEAKHGHRKGAGNQAG